MSMSKKDFELIARALSKRAHNFHKYAGRDNVLIARTIREDAYLLAVEFERNYPNFNLDTFMLRVYEVPKEEAAK